MGGISKGLQRDVDKYLKGLTQIRKSRTGRHIKPLRPATIQGRRAELQAAARMAVKIGRADRKAGFAAVDAQAKGGGKDPRCVLAKERR